MPKYAQLPEWIRLILESYLKILLAWRHVGNLEAIKKIEREKWPNPDLQRRYRNHLVDAKSARMCSLLGSSGEELLLSDFFELFTDKITEKDPDKLSSDEKRDEYERNRKKVLNHVRRLEEYNLIKLTLIKLPGRRKLYKVKAEPFLYECLIDIIPHIKECWNIPDIGDDQGDGTRFREAAARPSQPNKKWKHPQLSEIDQRSVESYLKILLAWGHVGNLEAIKKIEREKWPNPNKRRQYRNCLLDAKSANMCILLSVAEEEIMFRAFVELFTDKITEMDPDKPLNNKKGNEFSRNEKLIERTLERLEEYNLVKLIRNGRGKPRRVRAEPFLYQCLIEIIPFIKECWKIPDDESASKH